MSTTVENFPKNAYSRADVEGRKAIGDTIPGVISSAITEDADNYILTTTFPDGPVPVAAAAPAPAAAHSAAASLPSAIKAALRLNEIGGASPYQLSFAAKGKSGASFGFMQGDMAMGAQFVRDTFQEAMHLAGMDANAIARLAGALSVPLFHNPLNQADTLAVNAALAAPQGRAQVDAMDDRLCTGVLDGVAACVQAAEAAGKTVDALAQIYMALWINMTGPPSTLLAWLGGQSVFLTRTIPAPGPDVDGPAMEAYLRATTYFTENPQNIPHFLQSAAAGGNQLIA